MKSLAVIPARGGSKRLKRKNILDFHGKPMIGHTIEAAQKSGLFEKIVVSTEDSEIAEIASRWGVEIHERSTALASDTALIEEVCLQVLEEKAVDILMCLYATAPLRNAEDIRSVHALIDPGKCEFAMATTDYFYSPYEALKQGPDGLEPMFPEWIHGDRSQQPSLSVDNGSTYAVWVPSFKKQKTFYGELLQGYSMPRLRSIDINDQEDFRLTEALF